MATIETAEGQTLLVDRQTKDARLRVEGHVTVDGHMREFDENVYRFYSLSADAHGPRRPRSRGELTTDVVQDFVNRLVGYAVAKGWAERRSDVEVNRVCFYERADARQVSRPLLPDYIDGWPEDGSQSDKIRFILEESPMSDERIAAGLGCSRSLVIDVRERMEEAE